MVAVGAVCLVVLVGVWMYFLRRRRDVMRYHDIDEVRINRHREGGV